MSDLLKQILTVNSSYRAMSMGINYSDSPGKSKDKKVSKNRDKVKAARKHSRKNRKNK